MQNQGQPQGQQQININPEDTTGISCDHCKSEFYIPVYMLRKVSAVLSPSGREEIIQVPVMACAQCGKPDVPKGFDTSEDEPDEKTEGDGSKIIMP